jgi:isoleucyl-tRNA synthetase
LTNANGSAVTFAGNDLKALEYYHPIHSDMTGKVVTGEHVELTAGTGAVHTAPGHGQEDYLVGVAYDLPLLMPVDDDGVFDSGGGAFAGMDVEEANPQIIAWLGERGSLVGAVDITHSYPHCWRCHNPVIFRATDQWFVSMEANGLREKALSEIEKLKWYPDWAIKRLNAMIENRPDWCISRQRSWGVPIPVFKCAKCSSTIATPETFDAVIELFEREGADAWFARQPAEYLPADTACPTCGGHEILPERDILDVWWESGVSHTSVLDVYPELSRPADIYLEGSDQHRGWFQSSLLTSVGAYNVAPYRGIMSCGFTVDENGEKMSKSKGNGVDPLEVIAKNGADVLRLWVASVDSATDVRISDDILNRCADAYRRFRNTFRFLLSNLYDFETPTDVVAFDELTEIDRWAYARLQKLTRDVEDAFEEFRWHQGYHALYDYVVTDLSAVYLDGLKDRLYSDGAKSLPRRSAQTVLLNILEVLVRLLAPILTFTTDEVLENYPDGLRRSYAQFPAASMLAGWPEAEDFVPAAPKAVLADTLASFELVLAAREVVTKALEDARAAKTVGKSQEAHVTLKAPQAVIDALSKLAPNTLPELLIVAAVDYVVAPDGEPTTAEIDVAAGEKCPRCWSVRELGTVSSHPEVCERCAHVLEEL